MSARAERALGAVLAVANWALAIAAGVVTIGALLLGAVACFVMGGRR